MVLISTQLGKLDASHGSLFFNNDNTFLYKENQEFNIFGLARNVNNIKFEDKLYYIVSRNNDTPIFLLKDE